MRFVPDRPGHDRRYALDITKIKTQLGWQPQEILGSGLQQNHPVVPFPSRVGVSHPPAARLPGMDGAQLR